jgi:transcriptional regulator
LLLTADNKTDILVALLSTVATKDRSMPPPTDRLQGTLDLLVLRALQTGPMHGWAVAQRLQLVSRDVLQVGQGSLYPALHRLEDEGWIEAEWGISEAGRRAKFYQLTTSGRNQLTREIARWSEFATAVGRVLEFG